MNKVWEINNGGIKRNKGELSWLQTYRKYTWIYQWRFLSNLHHLPRKSALPSWQYYVSHLMVLTTEVWSSLRVRTDEPKDILTVPSHTSIDNGRRADVVGWEILAYFHSMIRNKFVIFCAAKRWNTISDLHKKTLTPIILILKVILISVSISYQYEIACKS